MKCPCAIILLLFFLSTALPGCGGGGDRGDSTVTVEHSQNWDQMKWDRDNWR